MHKGVNTKLSERHVTSRTPEPFSSPSYYHPSLHSPVNFLMGIVVLHVTPPAGCATLITTLVPLLVHALVVEEKLGSRLGWPGTLQATWLSAEGLTPAMKLQTRLKLPGKPSAPTGSTWPPRRYWHTGVTAVQSVTQAGTQGGHGQS
jgi:hypothetical protein